MKIGNRVKLAPEWEAKYGGLTWEERLRMAATLEGIARQLRGTANALRPHRPVVRLKLIKDAKQLARN